MSDGLDVHVAEVYSYNQAWKIPEKHFSLNVLIRDKKTNTTRHIENVIPANHNFKQVPIIGENVLIFLGYNEETQNSKGETAESDTITRYEQWYYLNPVNIRFNVTENLSFSNSSDKLYPPTSDDEFVAQSNEVSINSLQPYAGDILIEGRWGNTIRLGSTSKKNNNKYAIEQPWVGNKASDSIIILSNSKQLPKSPENNNKLRVENIEEDRSCLYLTTTQQLTKLKLGTKNKKNPLSKFTTESNFKTSQFIGIADRIVLKANKDIVVLDAPKAIVLNTTGYIMLGNDKANEPLPHGRVLANILQKILDQLSVPILAGSNVGTFMQKTSLIAAQKEMKNLLNQKFYITKNTY
jgi:hypothetical protein